MRWWVGLCAATALVGCDDTGALVEDQRASIESTIAKLGQVGADAASRPAETDATLTVPAGADFGPNGNGVVVSPNQLTDPCEAPDVRWDNAPAGYSWLTPAWRGTADTILGPPACYVRDGRFRSELPESLVRRAVDSYGRLAYVLVVRVRRAVLPRVAGVPPAGEPDTFATGAIVGDALLYDLSSGSYVDGFAFTVVNDEELEVVNEDIRGQLAANLVQRLDRTVDDALRSP